MRRRGFTLIELLVAIAILAILAALLFPVFAKARAKARQASCLSNLKQTTLGFIMYMDDYDECLPNLGYECFWAWWPNERIIEPYLKNADVIQCPSTDPAYLRSLTGAPSPYIYCYALYNSVAAVNVGACFVCPKPTYSLADVRYPANKILLWEVTDVHDTYNRSYRTRRNFSFIDGHVKFLDNRQLEPRDPAVRYDPNWTYGGVGGIDFR